MPSGSYISTHDLTRRSTGSHVCTGATPAFQLTTSRGGRHYPPQYNRKYVQVFQLTTSQGGRRGKWRPLSMSWIFQLTTSQGGRPCRMIQRQAFWLFQLTTSQGGRRRAMQAQFWTEWISTHDLTRRSTFMLAGVYSAEYVFQLTTSRRGRQILDSQCRKEKRVSTHDLTKRSTWYCPNVESPW